MYVVVTCRTKLMNRNLIHTKLEYYLHGPSIHFPYVYPLLVSLLQVMSEHGHEEGTGHCQHIAMAWKLLICDH